MINFTDNKKLNIKINILLAAFLENEFHDNEICINEINKSFKENIGIWTYIYKTDDGYYHPTIAVDSNNSSYMRAINQIIDLCKDFDINLKANYNKYHATIDCYFPDLTKSILI